MTKYQRKARQLYKRAVTLDFTLVHSCQALVETYWYIYGCFLNLLLDECDKYGIKAEDEDNILDILKADEHNLLGDELHKLYGQVGAALIQSMAFPETLSELDYAFEDMCLQYLHNLFNSRNSPDFDIDKHNILACGVYHNGYFSYGSLCLER